MHKREAILDAALILFAERGFHGTSVAQIAERANVGAGTIYRYFEDKEVLVNVLYKYWKREMATAIIGDLPMGLPARQLFHEIWSRMLRFGRENPGVLVFMEFHHHAPYLDDESRNLANLLAGQFHGFLEKLRAEQVTREAPPELLFAMLTGAFTGIEKAARGGLLAITPEIEAEAEEICWQMIRR
ncbi:TetR/AcrR family transcriptional regulator [Thermodesulfobacteriota bacterium]